MEIPSIEKMKDDLINAGWKQMRPSWCWKSPDGELWIGPYQAWKVLQNGHTH